MRRVSALSLLSASLCLCLAASGMAGEEPQSAHASHDLDYDHQETWHGVLDHAQSPVDIVTASAVAADADESAALLISSKRAPGKVADTGHAIQVDTDAAEALIRGRHFELAQFHFHSPSEHTIDGRSYPLEGHFVFRARDGRLAVVGVMYEEGGVNDGIEPVLEQLRHPGTLPAEVDVASLLPEDKGYYHYLGSLTTPPLTENVEWYVLSDPMKLSKQEIAELHDRYPHNNRKVQPMNGRPLVHFGD